MFRIMLFILILFSGNSYATNLEISTAGTNLGIGTTSQANALSIASTLAVGSSYTSTTAPSNGVIIQGNVGVGTSNPEEALDVQGAVRGNNFIPNHLGFVATRGNLPLTSSSINKQMMSRTFHIATDNIAAAELVFSNWGGSNNNTEAGTLGADSTITASIEYPAGTYNQVTWSAATSGTIPNGGTLFSDMITLSTPIPVGAVFWVRCYQTNTGGIWFGNNQNSNTGYDAALFGVSGIADQTMSNTTLNAAGKTTAYEPTAIIGYTSKPSVLIIGDSRAVGQFDTVDSADLQGYERLIGKYYGYANESLGLSYLNTGTVGFINYHTQKMLLAPYATAVIGELGINDINAATSLSSVISSIATFTGLFSVPVYWTTEEPSTTSTDNFQTLINQTPTTYDSVRATFNDDLRNNLIPTISGYIEMANSVESSLDSGLWMVNGTANWATSEGLHPNQLSNIAESWTAIPFSGLYNSSQVNSALPVSGGSINGTLAVQGTLKSESILDNGNVGIGTLSPIGKFEVGTGNAPNLFVPAAGNVGIGTVTAGSLLTVGSTGQFTVSTTGATGTGTLTATGSILANTNIVTSSAAGIIGGNSATGASATTFQGGASTTSIAKLQSTSANGTSDSIRFLVGNAGATEAMRIQDNSGTANVGINTTIPNNALVIKGSISHQWGFNIPVLTSCGGAPTVKGTDNDFQITIGSVATGCTATFGGTYQDASCLVSNQSMSITSALTYTVSNTAVVISQATGLSSDLVNVHCDFKN